MTCRIFIIIGFIFLLAGISSAQDMMEQRLSLDIKNETIDDALLLISDRADINIFFPSDIFDQKETVNLYAIDEPLGLILKRCLDGTKVGFRLSDGSVILFKKKSKYYNLSGYLTDAQTGDRLVGANLISLDDGNGCASNAYGFYSKNFKAGKNKLRISYLGYQSKIVEIDLSKVQKLDISLEPAITLTEIIVKPKEDSVLLSNDKIAATLPLSWLAQAPTAGGESDVVRYLHFLPGIQSGADGFGGLHIRGGNSDQNLILFDDVPVYNPSHTFGFYSIFNPDLVKSVQLYKSGFPARYDGRISSVLDVRTREANNQKVSGNFSIGTTALRGMIEFPIHQGKGGILLAGRKTHIDLWLRPLSRHLKSKEDIEGQMAYQFYDLNIKAHYSVSEKDKVYISQYIGKDIFSDDEESEEEMFDPEVGGVIEEEVYSNYTTYWGNTISSIRWNHLFNNRLFSNTTLTYSQFEYLSTSEFIGQAYIFDEPYLAFQANSLYNSLIKNYALRSDFDFFANNRHQLKWGANISLQNFRPGLVESELLSDDLDGISTMFSDNFDQNPVISTQMLNVYAEDIFTLKKWTLHTGLHLSAFQNEAQLHIIPQPRFILKYNPSNYWKASVSAVRTTQFFNLLTRSDAGLPNDLWVPTTEGVDPQDAWQFNLGLSGNLGRGFHWKTEVYYKKMFHLLRLKNEAFDPEALQAGALIIEGDDWVDLVEQGEGNSYGLELTFEKQKGKLTGWISYTWNTSNRFFNNQKEPYLYDIRHSISLTSAYQINNWLSASANFMYQSGRPFSTDSYDERDIPFFNLLDAAQLNQNATRLPAYHRIDLGLNALFTKKRFTHKINLSIYNAYNQKNILFAVESGPENVNLTGAQGLGLIPSLSYSIAW